MRIVVRSFVPATSVIVLALCQAGCATKGFVRDQVGLVQSSVSAEQGAIRNDLTEARRKADSAYSGVDWAKSLALGNVNYKEVQTQTVHFEFDSAEINADSEATLNALAALLQEHALYLVEIYGHTDTVGPSGYNDELSVRRATAVQRFLADHAGGPLWRYAMVGLGEAHPLDGPSEEDRSGSRRVVVRVVERVEPNASDTHARRGV